MWVLKDIAKKCDYFRRLDPRIRAVFIEVF